MLRRSKSLKSLALLGMLVVALLVANDQLLKFAARSNPSSRVNWLFNTDPLQVDYAVLGSSMAKAGINPAAFETDTNASIVQLAWNGRGISEQALYWELFLERHSCETLLLELLPRGLERDALAHPLDEFGYLAHLDNSIVDRHFRREFGWLQTTVWKYIPMWGMAQFSTQTGWHEFVGIWRDDAFEPNVSPNSATMSDPTEIERLRAETQRSSSENINGNSVEQFREVLELCHSKNIRVIAFVPPIYGGIQEAESGSILLYRKLLGDAIPVFEPSGAYLQDVKYFQDARHVNELGAQEFTRELATSLAP